MLKNRIPVRRWKQWLVLPVLGGLFMVACRTADVRPASIPSAGAEPVTIVSAPYRRDDKVAFKLAWRQMRREDSLRNGKVDATRYNMSFSAKEVPSQPGVMVTTFSYVLKSQLPVEHIYAGTTPHVYIFAEQMPALPGNPGTEAIVQAIQANLIYPKGVDGKALPEAKAFASFVVGADGTVQDPKILKSAGPAYDVALLAAIGKMPRLEPGRQDGQPVAVSFTVPVLFKPQP